MKRVAGTWDLAKVEACFKRSRRSEGAERVGVGADALHECHSARCILPSALFVHSIKCCEVCEERGGGAAADSRSAAVQHCTVTP